MVVLPVVPTFLAGGLVDVLGTVLFTLEGVLLLTGAVTRLLLLLAVLVIRLVSVVLLWDTADLGSRALTIREGWNVRPVAFSTSLTCGPTVYLLLPPFTVP